MGESSKKWGSMYNQDGLRSRYMALLVPALARAHANYPHGSGQLERTRAIRRAADTCLVQALATRSARVDHHHQHVRAVDQTCLPFTASAASRPRPPKLPKAPAARRGSSSCRLHALIMKGKSNSAYGNTLKLLRGRNCRIRKRGAHAGDYCRSSKLRRRNRGGNQEARDAEGWMPAESELQRLQSVMFPRKNKKSTDDKCAGDDEEDCSGVSVVNPAALLSQAAHYIIALQVQVEALRSLANLSVE